MGLLACAVCGFYMQVSAKRACPDCVGSGSRPGSRPVFCKLCRGFGSVRAHHAGFDGGLPVSRFASLAILIEAIHPYHMSKSERMYLILCKPPCMRGEVAAGKLTSVLQLVKTLQLGWRREQPEAACGLPGLWGNGDCEAGVVHALRGRWAGRLHCDTVCSRSCRHVHYFANTRQLLP